MWKVIFYSLGWNKPIAILGSTVDVDDKNHYLLMSTEEWWT